MFNCIKPHYNEGDISQRKQQYYQQILEKSSRSMSPFRTKLEIKQIPQPGKNNNEINLVQNYSIPSLERSYASKRQQFKGINPSIKLNESVRLNESQMNSQKFQQKSIKQHKVSLQHEKVLKQRQQLLKKLQIATLGLPYEETQSQAQLLSNNYLLPHYKSGKSQTIIIQQQKIKQLTNQILSNQRHINRMNSVKKSLVQRVDRIRKIDKQIFANLDQDSTQQHQNYLRLAKNALAEGESQQKVISILKKILY